MLSAAMDWSDRFAANSNSIPSTIVHHTDTHLNTKSKKHVLPISSTYQIVFDSINGIPVPAIVLQKASKINSKIGCKLSISLFDLESASFIGKTWHSPFAIPVIKPVDNTEPSSESEDEDSKSQKSGQIDMLRAHLVGNKLNVKLRNQCVYFHTQLQSKHIVAVLEVSFQVTGIHVTRIPECYSGGWTIMYLFNSKRGGLNLEEREGETKIEDSKTIPLFGGSPRILPFVASTLFEAAAGFPGMTPLPGSSIQYYLLMRPDIKRKTLVWKENCFIGPGDDVPGIYKLNLRGIQLNRTEVFVLSQIRINASPSLDLFEEKMLEIVRNHYYAEHPEEISMDNEGRLSMPQILEARMHVGFHNSFNFVQPPTIINLLRNNEEENVENTLEFLGNIKLEYLHGDGIELVFGVEYKILISVRGVKEEKNGFTKLVERLSTGSSSRDNAEIFGIEKFVTVGWGHCSLDGYGSVQKITLDSGSKPNPFTSLVYRAHTETYKSDRERADIDADAASIFAWKPLPLELEYLLQEENAEPVKPSPAIATPATVKMLDKPAAVESPPRAITPVKQVTIIEEQVEVEEDVLEMNPFKNEDFSPLPALPNSGLKNVLSRIEKSRIFQAGFEKFYDEHGKLPTLIENFDENLRFDINAELKDQRDNEVTLQFMALSYTDDFRKKMGEQLPKSVSFSFQLYTFPNVSTERLQIYTGSLPPNYQKAALHNRSSSSPGKKTAGLENTNPSYSSDTLNNSESELWPGIFYRIEQDGRPAYDKPAGLSAQFNIDRQTRKSCSNVRYGATSFPFYLYDKQLYIDLWDGDSLLYLGTACLDLKCALRQGRDGVCFEDDVDIMLHEYLNEDSGHMRRSSSMSSHLSRQITSHSDRIARSSKIGSLHLKLTNIGRTFSKEGTMTNQPALGSDRIIVSDFHEEVKYRVSKVVESKRLADINMELKQMLQSSYQERMEMKKATLNATDPTQPLTEEGKKLQKVYRAMKKDNIEPPASWNISDYMNTGPESFVYKQSRQDRQKDLEIVELYRERHKRQAIQDSLRQQLTTKHVIDSSFGQGYFFEFIFENPYNADHTFEVSWDDDELRLITNENEWLYHRRQNNIAQGVETNILSQFTENRAEIFLKPLEKIAIPFIFQSYATAINPVHISSGVSAMKVSKDKDRESSRAISVSFLNFKKVPVAFLDVVTNPLNFYVDRSMQMFHSENDLVRKSLRYPITNFPPLGTGDPGIMNVQFSPTNEKFLKCSNSNVICSFAPFNKDSKFREISFQYRAGGAPDHSDIYFVIYHDKFCTNVYEIWKVSLHTIFRLDVNCVYGQTNSASLVLRGRTMTRQANCYVNLPSQIRTAYPGPFTIPANALAEIPLSLRLNGNHSTSAIANIVDTETRTLLSSWCIITHLSMPAITKVFEIKLQKGKACNKRISYTNPYLHQKLLYLKTDSPHLMQFKSNTLVLKGGEKQYIGLKFAPCFNVSNIEILVFLNNEMDKVEECLSISVQYE